MNERQQLKLVREAQRSEKEAFAILYRLFVNRIYAYFFVRLGARQDAEDLTTKVFMKVLKNINQFQGRAQFSTWLYAIARNELNDFFRSRKTEAQFDEEQYGLAQQGGEPGDSVKIRQQKSVRVENILSKLPERYSQVLRLRFLQNLSVKETAEVLGITEVNVKVRQLRALRKAKVLEDTNGTR